MTLYLRTCWPVSLRPVSTRVKKTMRTSLAVLTLLLFAVPAGAQTGYPMIISAYPTGIQRGKTAEVAITGRFNFEGAYGVQFGAPGLSAEIVLPAAPAAPADPKKKAQDTLTLKVTAAADAPVGPQEFRIATPRGLSSDGQLVAAAEPQVLEKEPNNTREQG